MREVEALVESAKAAIFRSKFDIESHFKDFDKNRRGLVTPAQFHQVLCLGQIHLKEKEVGCVEVGGKHTLFSKKKRKKKSN